MLSRFYSHSASSGSMKIFPEQESTISLHILDSVIYVIPFGYNLDTVKRENITKLIISAATLMSKTATVLQGIGAIKVIGKNSSNNTEESCIQKLCEFIEQSRNLKELNLEEMCFDQFKIDSVLKLFKTILNLAQQEKKLEKLYLFGNIEAYLLGIGYHLDGKEIIGIIRELSKIIKIAPDSRFTTEYSWTKIAKGYLCF